MATTNFTKADLIRAVEEAIGPDADAELIVQSTLDAIVEGIQSGEAVKIKNFGSFYTRQRRGRLARNPKTGATGIVVPPKTIVFFVPSKDSVEMISGELK